MKTRIILVAALCAMLIPLQASAKKSSDEPRKSKQVNDYKYKNDFRLGFGDMLFETLIWHDQPHKVYDDPYSTYLFPEDHNYGYTSHLSLEYNYRLLPWLSLGAAVDYQQTFWDRQYYTGTNVLVGTTKENFYNVCILPRIRFHYFRRPNVELYSAFAAGLDINGGSEVNGKGQKTVCGMAMELTLLGVMAGENRWWGFFDLGGLYAMKNKNNMFMMSSQIFKAGVIFKF